MPADALPIPRTPSLTGSASYRRSYVDSLGRPMTGAATFQPSARNATDALVVTAAPVVVQLVAGSVAVDLPAGRYRITANLRSVDGAEVTDEDTVTID